MAEERHDWRCDCEWCWLGVTDSPPPPQPTVGERIYRHGVLSLSCVALMIASYFIGEAIWQGIQLLTFGWALIAGYHIGKVAWLSLAAPVDPE